MRCTTKILLATLTLAAALATRTGSAAAPPTLTCPTPASTDLVGFWEFRATSKGGIGHALEFRPDGSFVEATTVINNGFYRVSGDGLSVGETPSASTEVGSKFQIQGDALIQTSPDGLTLKKERLGKAEADSPPIVGA